MKNIIIGTAGHVDHGKTEIVRALTGRETDRLREEKSRGISIVLGFAPIDLGEGIRAGIIDVPGHEKFIKNMVSGAVGVDLVIFVIAADEGVMLQTKEHFEVLRMLGVENGIVVITKVDLADPELIGIVESEASDLIKNTPLENSPIIRASIVSGEGLDELKQALIDKTRGIKKKRRGAFFRMPVDRSFSKAGIGTIVTGSAWSGRAALGDELVVEPPGKKVRVREVQSFDNSLEESSSGMRVALALHGVKSNEISIGNQILTPGKLKVSSMVNASVEVGMIRASKIKNRQRLRFHHAAGEIMCRAVLLDREELGKGAEGFVQLRLEKPTAAMRGDRFVLRTYSPMRVVGGGMILDPLPAKTKGFSGDLIEELKILRAGSNKEIVEMLINREGKSGILPESIEKFGIGPREIEAITEELEGKGNIYRIGPLLISSRDVMEKENELKTVLESFMKVNNLIWGMDKEGLRARLRLDGNQLFDFILEKGRNEGWLFSREGLLRYGSAERALASDEENSLLKLEELILAGGFEFPSENELAGEYKRELLTGYLHILRERKSVVRIKEAGYIHSEYISKITGILRDYFADENELDIGKFKKMLGVSRKFAVPILEHLDGIGYTKRVGNRRIAGPELAGAEE